MTGKNTKTNGRAAARVRLALVGLGGHGRTIQQSAAETASVDVRAVYDPDEAEAAAAAQRFGAEAMPSFEALLARGDLDAVALTTPNVLHRPQTEAALAAGLDVLVEKPLANTLGDARAMIAAAEAAGRILMVGHNMRRAAPARRARALLASGAIGELVTAEVHFSSPTALRLAPGAWRLRPEECPLLPVMQLGIHGIDLLHYLVGPVTAVQASARSVSVKAPVVDTVVATLALSGGAHGVLVTSYCSAVRFVYSLCGTAGTLSATPHTLVHRGLDGEVRERLDESETPLASYTAQMAAFAEAVRTRKPPETDGACGLHALAVVEALERSLQAAPTAVFAPSA